MRNEIESTLLPCPFCGSADVEFRQVGDNRRSCIVHCLDCGCTLESNENCDLSGSQWNTRADNTAQLREACEEIIKLKENVNNHTLGSLQQWVILLGNKIETALAGIRDE